MALTIRNGTEFVLRLPRQERTLEQILKAASVVGDEITATAWHRDGDLDVFHVAVTDDLLFEPHFRSNYRKAVEKRPIVLVMGQLRDDRRDVLLEALAEADVAVEYCYAAAGEVNFSLALRTSDLERTRAVLTQAVGATAAAPPPAGSR